MRFAANVVAGNETELMIRDLVESFGLTIGTTKGPGVICAVSTLESIYTKYGYHVLSRVLTLCIGTWEGDSNSFSANIMNAVAKLVAVYGDSLNDELFKEKLGVISVKQLQRKAKDRRPGSMGFAEVMVLEYNGKKKSPEGKLRINLLYASESKLLSANLRDFVVNQPQEIQD